jgi:hypothetical protein
VTLKVKNIEALTEQLALGHARPRILLGLQVSAEVAMRALVWEWGRVTCQPGPKTLWSENFQGETVVLTKTAPFGYIRVNRAKYRQFIREEIKNLNMAKLKPSQWNPALEQALRRAAKRCAELMAATAPVDSGRLREEIQAAKVVDVTTADVASVRTGLSL